jgi:Lon protease-like protein
MSSDDPGQDDLFDRPSLVGADFAAALRRIPMFPLPTAVLFPSSLMPLHIFEERYRKMTRDLLAGNRLIVMGLQIGHEHEHDGVPPVATIAGVGEIVVAHEFPDGRFNLVLRGRARVRIDAELPSDEPYRLVACSEVPDEPVAIGRATEIAEADASLRALVGGLADALPTGGDLLKQVVAAQETPAALVDVLASTILSDTQDKQRLLETTDVGRRLERLAREVVETTARVSPGRRAN